MSIRICNYCGKKLVNCCIHCGKKISSNKTRCSDCGLVAELNIKQDKKFRDESTPTPHNWNKIMQETLNPVGICPDCSEERAKQIDYKTTKFWVKFRREHPL